MVENKFKPDLSRIGSGTVSQCFTCHNKQCNRCLFKKNKLHGIEEANDNPGVSLSKYYCSNRKERKGK